MTTETAFFYGAALCGEYKRELSVIHLSPCEVFRAENDPNRIDAGRRLGSVVRGSDGPV